MTTTHTPGALCRAPTSPAETLSPNAPAGAFSSPLGADWMDYVNKADAK